MKKINFSKMCFKVIVMFILLISCNNNSKTQESNPIIKGAVMESKISVQPLKIKNSFIPCGWMGDGQSGTKYIRFEPKCTETPHSGETCIKITYTTGPKGWAGIYWLNSDCNWGDEMGLDLSKRGFSKISFWARGAQGGESSQFKAGGVGSKKYKDSFDYKPNLNIELTNEWTEYTIDIKGKDLSNVIGGFCWVSNADVTIYLDDLKYE